MLVIPDPVRAKARLAGAEDWLTGLPGLVADLERRWSITVGESYPDGTEAFVARALTADGAPSVLKIVVPQPTGGSAAQREITVLRLADGQGCVRAILCDLARQLWRPAPDAGLPTGADQARWLAELIPARWAELDRPCSEAAVEHALDCARRRLAAHDDERARLLHGDVHEWNALRTADGFALVDPDGLLAEPECDLGILMREDPVQLLRDGPGRQARWLAARTGCDPTAVWEWGVIERVSTGLLGTSIGLQPIAGQMLRAADLIAADRLDGEPPAW